MEAEKDTGGIVPDEVDWFRFPFRFEELLLSCDGIVNGDIPWIEVRRAFPPTLLVVGDTTIMVVSESTFI